MAAFFFGVIPTYGVLPYAMIWSYTALKSTSIKNKIPSLVSPQQKSDWTYTLNDAHSVCFLMMSTLSVTSRTNLKQSGSEILVLKVNIFEDSDETTQKMHILCTFVMITAQYSGLGWPISF